jgi:hypothetical protein
LRVSFAHCARLARPERLRRTFAKTLAVDGCEPPRWVKPKHVATCDILLPISAHQDNASL